jgi:hypothetical protein
LKQLMINCQATFCTPFKVCQNWARFIRNVKLCKFIENTLKIDYSGRNFNIVEKGKKNAYGECRKNFIATVRFLVEHYPNVGFIKCKVKRVVNLFEDTGSVRELKYLAKIFRSCFSPLWKN